MIPAFIPGFLFIFCWLLLIKLVAQAKQIKGDKIRMELLKRSIGPENFEWIVNRQIVEVKQTTLLKIKKISRVIWHYAKMLRIVKEKTVWVKEVLAQFSPRYLFAFEKKIDE
jgi:hypothetical protein